MFQIVDVNKLLGAVASRVDQGCTVVYNKDMVTGQDLSYIFYTPSKKVMKMRREGNALVLDAIVASEMVTTDPFSRQG